MKKYALLLVVALLAAPALAVKVEVVPTGPLTADITYDNEGADVAAYAIDIDLSAGDINEVTNFAVGVSTAAAPGYGIFPGSFRDHITVDAQGDVVDWSGNGEYTPLADPCDKGENPTGITIELGALYKGEPNKPAGSGILCTIKVTEACTATPKLNTIRGGVVLADASSPATVTLIGADIQGEGPGECFDPAHPSFNDWVALGRPDCWCWTTHCKGDADGLKQGNSKTGFIRVYTNDLNTLVAAWNVKEPPFGPGIATVAGGICADFNYDLQGNSKTGFIRVYTNDLNILVGNWNVKDPPFGPGLPATPVCPGQTPPADL